MKGAELESGQTDLLRVRLVKVSALRDASDTKAPEFGTYARMKTWGVMRGVERGGGLLFEECRV